MKFNGILTGVENNPFNGRNYYRAGVLDDSPIQDRMRTEINVGINEEEYAALKGAEGQKVQVTCRIFRSVRNGIPEFEGRVTLEKQTAGAK